MTKVSIKSASLPYRVCLLHTIRSTSTNSAISLLHVVEFLVNQVWNVLVSFFSGTCLTSSTEILRVLTGLDLLCQLSQDLKVLSSQLRQDLRNQLCNVLFLWVTSEGKSVCSWSTLHTNSVEVQHLTVVFEKVSFFNTFNLSSLQFTQGLNQFGVILFGLDSLLCFDS
ncbi:conserved hypothetical protein [Lodderomyces elongisporus NRRL YB-4239]|uniref:Uncharacterized protein n=1 Tax=Lodderomyces elongisporus (strain ATCC 11503 / CBS 2605 / JCM 1781 / NBRC 1676 / NRRL YB-4239) TaxID=379508 RepID=A5DT58_LODEL|nr:conserved hypothetical protein [Lodderomyces elongisporus NRRL YB-4239]